MVACGAPLVAPLGGAAPAPVIPPPVAGAKAAGLVLILMETPVAAAAAGGAGVAVEAEEVAAAVGLGVSRRPTARPVPAVGGPVGEAVGVVVVGARPVLLARAAAVANARQVGAGEGAALRCLRHPTPAAVPAPVAAVKVTKAAVLAQAARLAGLRAAVGQGVDLPIEAAQVPRAAAGAPRVRRRAVVPRQAEVPQADRRPQGSSGGPRGRPRPPCVAAGGDPPLPRGARPRVGAAPAAVGPRRVVRPRVGGREKRTAATPLGPLVRRGPEAGVRSPEAGPVATRQGAAAAARAAPVEAGAGRRQVAAATPRRAPAYVHAARRRLLRGPPVRARLAAVLAPAVPTGRGGVGRVAGASAPLLRQQPQPGVGRRPLAPPVAGLLPTVP